MYKLCLFRQELLAQLNDNARSERNLTDEQMLRIVIDEYLSQQVFEPSLIEKYSDEFTFVVGRNYPMLQQLAALFLGMLAEGVPVECLFSVSGLIFNSRRSIGVQRGCGRCDGPGHPPWGASKGPVFVKECR